MSFAILWLKHFFDQRTVKEPSSETLLRSAKLVLKKSFQLKLSNIVPILLTVYLPWVTKRDFLLTISIQYQA